MVIKQSERRNRGATGSSSDQSINTRNYQKIICGQQAQRKCRMCSQHKETVDHIVSRCEVLAKTEYIYRQLIRQLHLEKAK